jgi:hypothetical protein
MVVIMVGIYEVERGLVGVVMWMARISFGGWLRGGYGDVGCRMDGAK